MRIGALLLLSLVISFALGGSCGNCGNGVVCPGGECCSKFGWCGITVDLCCEGCQSNCHQTVCGDCPPDSGTAGDGGELGKIISREMFNKLLDKRNNNQCPARCFYTYDHFIEAANAFPDFGNTGNDTIRKKDIAAFFAQTSHETNGGDNGPDSWGYCFNKVVNPSGRGLIQLTVNDALESFKSAISFWMTAKSPMPSCHQVITGLWTPSPDDKGANRFPGYGLTTNIINGGNECGRGHDVVEQVENRIRFFKNYCEKLGIQPGDNLDCYDQRPFGLNLMAQSM